LAVDGGNGDGEISATKTGGTGTGTVGVSGNNVTLSVTACGTFVIQVTKAASTGYLEKTQSFTVTVNKGTQTISGLSDVEKTYGDGTFSLSASAVGAVTYTISPSSVATVSGSTVTIAGAGTATITANAASTALYEANSATATLTVNKKDPTVTASVSPATIRVGGTATLTGSTDSGATLTFATSASGTASLSGSGATTRTVTGVAYGTATLTVNSPATANYNAGSATCTVTVKLVVPTTQVNVQLSTTHKPGDTTFAVTMVNRGTSPGRGTHWMMTAKAGSAPTTPIEGKKTADLARGNSAANAKSLTADAKQWPMDTSTLVIYNGNTTSAGDDYFFKAAVPATHYYVAAYEYNRSSTTEASYVYNTTETAGVNTFNFWTMATEPSGQASGVTAGTVGSRKASVTWTAGSWTAASGETASLKTLLIVVPSGSSVTAPTDGTTYSAGDTIGAGTVAFAGAGTSAEVTGLEPEHTYTVYAYAYAEGGDSTTANYLTTSPASRSITTIASQGPTVWATGVTTTNYLLNWSALSGDTAGYNVELDENSAFSSPWSTFEFTNNFTTGEGWTADTATDTTGYLTVGTASGNDEKWYVKSIGRRVTSSESVQGTSDTGYLYLTAGGSYVDTPVLYGDLTEIKVGWRNGNGSRTLRVDLVSADGSASATPLKSGIASWTTSTSYGTAISTATFTNGVHLSGGKGYRIRFYNNSGSSATLYLHYIFLRTTGLSTGQPGYGMEVGGLTSGSTYYARVRKAPEGDWSDELGVKAGVMPATVSSTSTRNSVTFTWTDTQTGAVGYGVQASETAAASTWADKSAGNAALALDSFGTKDWKYIGATATTSSGTLGTAPGYASGHIPGVAGN
ncbi:MAG: hypothetical protein J6Y19_07000, partial [Kiritimatiellae bacterium]|nr:hypothetical protein [Kiritimatiellia bacterium]